MLDSLQSRLPLGAVPLLQKWIEGYPLRLTVTKKRTSKLGDYRKAQNGQHQISINGNLEPDLFFLVFTHEIAHLLAFERYSRRIAPHGMEWKITFGKMILESIDLYPHNLQRILLPFARSPKANFMASPDLVKYFESPDPTSTKTYVENLQPHDKFEFKGQSYLLKKKMKKNYLCEQLGTGRLYKFSALAKVEKLKLHE